MLFCPNRKEGSFVFLFYLHPPILGILLKWCTWLFTGGLRSPFCSTSGRPIHGLVTSSLYSPASYLPPSINTWKIDASDLKPSPPQIPQPLPSPEPRRLLSLLNLAESAQPGFPRRCYSAWIRLWDISWCWRSCRLTEAFSWLSYWGLLLDTFYLDMEMKLRRLWLRIALAAALEHYY